MKKVAITIILLALLLAGCGLLPKEPPVEELQGETNTIVETPAAPETQQPAPADATPPAAEVAPPVESKYTPAEPVIINETNETAPALQISGSINLQSNPQLCPHLVRKFDCDKYDLARCGFKTLVGQNDFFPDYLHCREGYVNRGEDPRHKYCFVQECRALEKDNIVHAYGGPVAFAEYLYEVEKTATGVMTHYTLLKCGEEHKEFPTSYDCRIYKSELRNI
jgi:hypothetical protein